MLVLVLSIVLFLALSGLMAAVDAAVLSVTRPEIDVMIQKGVWGSWRLSRVKQQITRSVVVIVIVTNTINVLGPILVSRQAIRIFGTEGIALITVVLTVGTIIFSEIVPKAVGTHYAPLIASASAPAISLGRVLLYPLVVCFSWLSEQFTKGTRRIGTEEQIRSLVRIGHRAGYIELDERELIHRVFFLNDKTAVQIMTPLARTEALGADLSLQQAAVQIRKSQFSRYPVFEQSIDQIKGFVLSRDVFSNLPERSSDLLISITKPVVICDAQTKSNDLLKLFRKQHIHLAIVQDVEKSVGIVTLEDVLEELVGEIEDEKDVAAHG